MSAETKKRSACKGLLTREYGESDVFISEFDTDAMRASRVKLKELFARFRIAQQNYDDTLTEEDEYTSSLAYYDEVRTKYVKNLREQMMPSLNRNHPDHQPRPCLI